MGLKKLLVLGLVLVTALVLIQPAGALLWPTAIGTCGLGGLFGPIGLDGPWGPYGPFAAAGLWAPFVTPFCGCGFGAGFGFW
jgi:hypothetical protein